MEEHNIKKIEKVEKGKSIKILKLKISEGTQNNNNSKSNENPPVRKKRRDKSDLGENFIAPDGGGWSWIVAIASGVNILVTFALAQQFGVIFREEYMTNLGITASKLTTIINMQIAVSAFTGLLNGPLFRSFTYRQVAFFGSCLTFLGLFLSAFAQSFTFYICSYSCCYGIGRGLSVSASSLAVNTYFKKKRKTATAYQFGVAGIGPIFCPYVAIFLLEFYGVKGTVLLFAGVSLHAIACSLVYHPVQWHIRKNMDLEDQNTSNILTQYEVINQVVEPETPVLPRSNDGWFGSLHSVKQQISLNDVCHEEESPLNKLTNVDDEIERRKNLSLIQKIILFFDLDLLRDFTYVNLALGLTLINFVEINFAILTPFILSDFGFSNNDIALVMTLLGFCDLIVRFLIPLITAKLNFSNKFFFVIGIIGMCMGRCVLVFTRTINLLIFVFIFLGICKAFRTVFWSLIIPGYVNLNRLPAAAGLQLLLSGVFSLICGPLIGLLRERTNFGYTLNFLNILCVFAILMWAMEALFSKKKI